MGKSAINKGNGLVKIETVTDAQLTGGFDGAIMYVEETKTLYEYQSNSGVGVDNTSILNTIDGGTSRWVGISGQYNTYSGGKPMLIYLDSDDISSGYVVTETYGQRYIVSMASDGGSIILPNPTTAAGTYVEVNINYSDGYELYIRNHENTEVLMMDGTGFESKFICNEFTPYWRTLYTFSNDGQFIFDDVRIIDNFYMGGAFTGFAAPITTDLIIEQHDNRYMINCRNTTDINVTLPYGGNRYILIKKELNNSAKITISGSSITELIDGKQSVVLEKYGDYLLVFSRQTSPQSWNVYASNLDEFRNISNVYLPNTSISEKGIIYKNNVPYLHDFNYGSNGTVTTEGKNVFIGESIANFTMGQNATLVLHSSKNIGIGYNSLNVINNGYKNISIGTDNLVNGTNIINNVAIGNYCLKDGSTGNDNVAIGNGTLSKCLSSFNIAIGGGCLSNHNGYAGFNGYNVAVGRDALKYLETGGDNVAIGYGAGMYQGVGTGTINHHLQSYACVYIGDYCRAFENDTSYETVIGSYTTGHGSRTVTIGNNDGTNDNTDTYLTGKLHNTGSIQFGDDSSLPSINNVGTIRYRETTNDSFVEMCVKTGDGTYSWVVIHTENW